MAKKTKQIHPSRLWECYEEQSQNITDFAKNSDCVYLFYNPATNLYKIGVTLDLRQRARHLSTQSGVALDIILALWVEPGYDEPGKQVERFLHDFFKSKRVIGEWFNLDLRSLVAIRSFVWKFEGQFISDCLSDHLNGRRVETTIWS